MELEKLFAQELDDLIITGEVQKIVRTQLHSTLTSILKDVMGDYSPFGKNVKKAIGEALQVDFSRLTLVDYNTIVSQVIMEKLDSVVLSEIQEPISKTVMECVGALEKKSWLLSEVIAKYIQTYRDNFDKREGEISLQIETDNWGTSHIYFDAELRGKEKYEHEYQLDCDKEGRLYSFRAGKWHPHRGDIREQPVHGSFDNFIFRLYANSCTIVLNEREVEKEWYLE